jgi:hypothetical protein
MKWHRMLLRDKKFQDEELKADTETDASEFNHSKTKLTPSYDYSRTNSAPLEFDAFCLFSYLEDDFYTKSFSKPHSSETNDLPGALEHSLYELSSNYKPGNRVPPVYILNKL